MIVNVLSILVFRSNSVDGYFKMSPLVNNNIDQYTRLSYTMEALLMF